MYIYIYIYIYIYMIHDDSDLCYYIHNAINEHGR